MSCLDLSPNWCNNLLCLAGFISTAVVRLFLGLNLTITGLVGFTGGLVRVVGGFIGLIVAIGFVFVVTFLGLEQKRFRRNGGGEGGLVVPPST